jgi:ribosomal protein S18 acetylase RimI-like enzyme
MRPQLNSGTLAARVWRIMSRAPAVIRRALPSDAAGIARVHIASADDSLAPLAREWPVSDLARRTEHWAAALQAADRVHVVATVAEQVVGFIGGGPPRKKDIPGGVEIYVVHVLPTHRGTGIGGQLWDLACTILRGPAGAPLYLETLAELPCCAFYDARGGEVLTRTPGPFCGGAVTYLDYYWPAGKPHYRRPRSP